MKANNVHSQTAWPYPALRGPEPAPHVLPESKPGPVSRGLSLRSNFMWALMGNVVYAVCQWGMIVALAKMGNTFMVGQFSLGLAIATPVLMFSNLHLRAVQATDATGAFNFSEYLRLRVVMTLAALAAITGIAYFGSYGRLTTMVILAVALVKAIETLSDIHYGLFQLHDRLDQTGASMMLRGTVAVIALAAGLYLTRNIIWACIWVAVVWMVVLLLFDVRRSRRLMADRDIGRPPGPTRFRRHWKLLCLALPLGIVTTIMSINLNMPRYFIQARMGEHDLGIFSAMAYATVAIALVSDSLANSAIPSMSRLYANGMRADFRRLLFRLLAAGALVGLAGLVVAEFAGARLLTIVYSAEYASQSRVFVILMLATAIHFVASMLNCGITSARCFGIQVPIFVLMAAANAWACARWVPVAGMTGGAIGMATGAVVRLALTAIVVGYLLWAPPGNSLLCRISDWEPGI